MIEGDGLLAIKELIINYILNIKIQYFSVSSTYMNELSFEGMTYMGKAHAS